MKWKKICKMKKQQSIRWEMNRNMYSANEQKNKRYKNVAKLDSICD